MGLFATSVQRPSLCFAILLAVIGLTSSLEAQLFERATVLENVRLRLPDRVVDGARIVIKGGRIDQLGTQAEKPMLSKTVDGGGRTVTPGFIDIDSRLSLGKVGAGPDGRAWDGFDRYDTDAIGEAFAGGVTTVCLVPGGSAGIHGTASVVRLTSRDEGGFGEVVRPDVALCVDLGSSAGPLARLRAFESIRKQFRAAVEHREALDSYEESLEEYTEALKKQSSDDKEGDKKDDEKKGSQLQAPPKPAGKGDPGKGDAKKKDEPKKPKQPKRRTDLEVLLRALDREMPVRVEAHHSEDILNALDLAEEFDLDLVICGATEAHLLADVIAEAEAKVILEGMAAGESAESGPRRRHDPRAAAVLEKAGVSWSVGSGGESSRGTGHLWLHGVRASQGTERDVFRELTLQAAQGLGIGTRRFGRLGRGAHADLVFWSADPLEDASARILEVWVGGKKVWSAPELPARREKETKF